MIGKQLKEMRLVKRLTQKDIADALGVSDSTVQKWEQDLADPNTDKLIKLAKILDCSLDYLFGFDSEKRNVESFILIENIKKLDIDKQKEVSRFVGGVYGT